MRNLFLLGLLSGAVATSSTAASAALVYATNGSSISRFDDNSLGSVTSVPITGLQTSETIVDIDVRPNSPAIIFAVGSSSRLYTLNPLTGAATQVGTAGAFTINGTAFGIDFNPTVDLLRFVSNTEQNLRINPNGTLAATDTALNPVGNIVSVAYSNNFPGAATTTLFGIDSAAGTLVTITNPNAGTVTTVGSLGLGTNLNEAIGFDISGASGVAQASITTAGISRLYSINLSTGLATLSSSNGGSIGGGTAPFVGFASSQAPEPATLGLFATTAVGLLVRRRRNKSP